MQVLDRFHLDDRLAVDDQVDSIAGVQVHALVDKRLTHLSLYFEVSKRELMSETGLVRGFVESTSENAVYLDCRADYSHFRPFEVDVKFDIAPPPNK